MWKSRFKKIALLLLFLVVLGVGLLLLSVQEGRPLVNSVELMHGSTDNAAIKSQSVLISLNEQVDIKADDISITPETPFTVDGSEKNYEIKFTDSLKGRKSYSVSIDGVLESFNFETKEQTMLYLHRKYKDDSSEKADEVIRKSNDKSDVIFKAPKIKTFTANYNYLAVVREEALQDSIIIKDRKTQEEITVPLPIDYSRIDHIDMPLYDSILAFTLDMDFTSYTKDLRSKYDRVFYIYDIESGELKEPQRNNDLMYIDTFKFGDHRDTLIYRDVFDTYYLDNINNKSRTKIGSYFLDGGFNNDESLSLLLNSSGISIYDVKNKRNIFITPETKILDFDFLYDDSIIFLEHLNESSSVSLQQVRNGELTSLSNFNSRDNLPTRINVSPNGRTLALESDLKECKLDWYDLHSRCEDSKITLYNLDRKEKSTEFNGIIPTWLP